MKKAYTVAALVILNTILLLVAVNLVAAAILAGDGDRPARYADAWLIDAYGFDVLKRAYPGWDDDDLRVLLAETSNWLFEYEPFTQFRQRPRADTFITIDPAGFRAAPEQGSWPPDPATVALFVFGGSTTMGAGVPDRGTIPAQLQARLDRDCAPAVRVYNFGRGFYYSTQERILFERLLLSGAVPSVAIFIDGLNDFYYPTDIPQFTDRLAGFMREANRARSPAGAARRDFPRAVVDLLRALPAWRLWRDRAPALIAAADAADFEAPAAFDEEAAAVIARWRVNRRLARAVAAAFDVRALFVWQPVPTYGYDLDHMNLQQAGKLDFGPHARSGAGYRQMARLDADGALGDDFLWLGDIQRGVAENLYVDAVHYTEAFSRTIADAIFERLVAGGLVACTR
jgi:hypothetical protein